MSGPTEAQVLERLAAVKDPELGRSIVELGMVSGVHVEEGRVRVQVHLTVPGCPLTGRLQKDIQEAVASLPQVGSPDRVEVELGVMTPQERQAVSTAMRAGPAPWAGEAHTRVVIVASGKGGVGKSTVAANLGASLARRGHAVGLLDADVYGFSIPRMVGLQEEPRAVADGVIVPPTAAGMKVMSMGSLVDDRTPVVWRGPMLSKLISQFLGDVQWGDLDYLVVDSPPGTGDVAISLQTQLPRGAILLVTTPQEAATAVAARVSAMAAKTGQRVLGVVENMAFFTCPHCGRRTQLFQGRGGEQLARELGVPLLGRFPLWPEVAQGADRGLPMVLAEPQGEAAQAFHDLAARVESAPWPVAQAQAL